MVLGDQIYIIGGEGVSGRPLLSVERLDIPSGSWRKVMLKLIYRLVVISFLSQVKGMDVGRRQPGATVWNGQIAVMGGASRPGTFLSSGEVHSQ